jgi:hypothetical protein
MTGIKIADLPNSALPYTGAERIPVTQDGQTRNGTLNSFANYISAFTPPQPPLTQDGIESAITDKSSFITEIGAVSGNGAGITDAGAFRVALELDDGNGNVPLNGFTLADHTNSVLAEGVYAEDVLGRLQRHDNATVGGVLVVPQRYTGFSVVDFTGKGNPATEGTVVPLVDLSALFSGAVVTGDQVQIFGQTSTTLNPADLPDGTVAAWGISFANTSDEFFYDYWDLSNEAGTATFQDLRTWSLTFTYNGAGWDISSPACFAVQQKTAAAGGSATVITGALTTAFGLNPAPTNAVDGVFTIPMSLIVKRSTGTFTTGEARVTWDLNLNIFRA